MSTAVRPSIPINFRAPLAKRELIDSAAEALGKSRTDFILDTLSEKAHEVLADRTRFVLTAEQLRRFNAALDAPVNNQALARLLNKVSPWE